VAWDIFGNTRARLGRVQAICDFGHRHIRFDYLQSAPPPHASRPSTSASACAADFAPLALTFCRASNIPARYINGHLGDIACVSSTAMDFFAGSKCSSTAVAHLRSPQQTPRASAASYRQGPRRADIPLINFVDRTVC